MTEPTITPTQEAGELVERLRKYGDKPQYNGLPVSDALHKAAETITNLQATVSRLEGERETGFNLAIRALLAWADGFMCPHAAADFCRAAASDLERNRSTILAPGTEPTTKYGRGSTGDELGDG